MQPATYTENRQQLVREVSQPTTGEHKQLANSELRHPHIEDVQRPIQDTQPPTGETTEALGEETKKMQHLGSHTIPIYPEEPLHVSVVYVYVDYGELGMESRM